MHHLFSDHPASVGETYTEHLAAASGFGFRMIAGGIACLLHGIFPFLFMRTGSDQIRLLHERMVTHRRKTVVTYEFNGELPDPQI